MYKINKRILDIIFSLILLVALFPIFVVLYVGIILIMGSPAFFLQKRIGKNNKEFSIIKFRTMKAKNDIYDTDNKRVTRYGKFLRKFSLDELPQLINILKGDMSFIGPRPLISNYIPFYTERESLRHNVLPGMSGLAQVSGRSNLTWDKQFELDVQYVENISFLLDLKILCKTIPKVLGSVDMMTVGRIDNERFDVYRRRKNKNNK